MPAPNEDAEWAYPNQATPAGSSAYYSVRFAPPELRDDLAALFGWRYLVRSVVDRVSDRGVAARKLEWWNDELVHIFAGRSRHPLARPLAALIARADLPRQPFVDILWGTEALLADRRMADFGALVAFADLDTGALFELIARTHGAIAPPTLGAARRAGAYCRLVDLIRDSGRLLRQDRSGFLPEASLARHGLALATTTPTAIRAHLVSLLDELAEDLARMREDLEDGFHRLPGAVRIQVRLMDKLLAELAATRFDVADQRIALTPVRKFWHAWRESRRGAYA